jgi:hypothetical protein
MVPRGRQGMEPGGRGALGKTKAKGRVADTMSRGRVAICALVATFTFAALAAPAMAKKEVIRYFEASGETKLSSTGGQQQFNIPFEGGGTIKIKCGAATGHGEIKPTEGKATSFTAKVKYESCLIKGKKKSVDVVTISPAEFEFRSNGEVAVLNEFKIEFAPSCKLVVGPQVIGLEAVEEGKKGPDTYATVGTGTTRQLEVKSKTHTHEEGESGGFEFEGEKALCETGEFKTEGGKYKGNMLFTATTGKEAWIGVHEEIL